MFVVFCCFCVFCCVCVRVCFFRFCFCCCCCISVSAILCYAFLFSDRAILYYVRRPDFLILRVYLRAGSCNHLFVADCLTCPTRLLVFCSFSCLSFCVCLFLMCLRCFACLFCMLKAVFICFKHVYVLFVYYICLCTLFMCLYT